MKRLTSNTLKLSSAGLGLVLCLAVNNAKAQQGYFDVNGTASGYGTATDGNYNWDDPNWASSSGGAAATGSWVQGDFARFYGSGNYAVNVGSDEQMVGLYLNASGILTLGDAGGALHIVNTAASAGDTANNLDGSFYQGFLVSYSSSAAAVVINSTITGAGGIEQQGYGSLYLNNHNTYSGGTETTGGQSTYYKYGDSFGSGHIVINGGGQALINNSDTAITLANPINFVGGGDHLILASATSSSTTFSGVQTFAIGANGVNNEFTGNGTESPLFDGTFTFDLSGADQTAGNEWQILEMATLNPTFGSGFSVAGFTQNGDLWTSGSYQFSEATGGLTFVPEPSTAALGLLGVLGVWIARRKKA